MSKAKELNTIDACVSAFSFEGADVRVFNRSDEPWWVLADVCAVLGISNVGNAKARLDVDELDDIRTTDTIGRLQETTIISESGLYSLILTSRKPAAKRFKKWVTSEVLPTIRKTGAYKIKLAKPRAKPIDLAFRQFSNIAKTAGLDSNQATLRAGRVVEKLYGLNVLGLLEIDTLPSPSDERTLSPRQLGSLMGSVTAQAVNKMLVERGFQTFTFDAKKNRIYHLTEAGKAFGRLEDTSRAHTEGAVTVLRWYPSVIDELREKKPTPATPNLERGISYAGGPA